MENKQKEIKIELWPGYCKGKYCIFIDVFNDEGHERAIYSDGSGKVFKKLSSKLGLLLCLINREGQFGMDMLEVATLK